MKCGNCGFDNPTGFKFCGQCAASLSSVCRNCGFENPPGIRFCGQCAKPLAEKEAYFSKADLDHLRAYLSPTLVEALQFELSSPSPNLIARCTTHLLTLLKTVSTHLPAYLIEQVSQDPTPGQVGGQFVNGTLLFADISGFTAMSERLNRLGQEGAEEITTIVNRYFSTMLSILSDYEGQLVKFGGDALLGLFTEPDSATRAVQAALRMQTAMANFAETETSKEVFSLKMKVGLRRGWFFAAQLGTSQKMEYAFFGADVNATAAAETTAIAGQVLLDQDTSQSVNLLLKTAPLPGTERYLVAEEIAASPPPPGGPLTPRPLLQPSPEPTLENLRRYVNLLDTFTPYLPAGLLARLASDPRAAILEEGEHRLIAVLFANVQGLDQIPDQLGQGKEDIIVSTLNHYFTAMADAVHRFGGVINKIDIYDHGSKLLAFFGAPLAHQDDAERAVRAALAMQESFERIGESLPSKAGLPQLHLNQQIGITFGYVFAGYVGTDWRREYTVMGDEVNLAARLMAEANPNRIVVSSNVRRKVQSFFNFTSLGEVLLPGKSEPVPVFSLVGPRTVPEPVRGLKEMRSSLVGRDREWKQLLTSLDELRLGRGQVVAIIGEAGLGKSRLIAELGRHLAGDKGRKIQWVEGHCLSYTEAVSYYPFQEIVRQIVDLRPEDGPWENWNRLRSSLEEILPLEDVQEMLPYLAHFLGLPVESSLEEKIRYLDAEALQRRTFVAISTLLERQAFERLPAKASPIVLVLEDIHWLDQASQTLLNYLMPLVNRIPLMLLLLYRPEREKQYWQIHEKVIREYIHCSTTIELSPLAATDSYALLTNLVPLDRWSDEILEVILDRTEGNPLYLEEVIRALIDKDALKRDETGQWRFAATPDVIKVPDTLQGVIMSRLDRLAAPCLRMVQAAAVFGRSFSFDMLSQIAQPERGSETDYCLTQVQQHQLIREIQRTPQLVYAFNHAMTQEVSYRSLLVRRRRFYHRRIARYLESNPSGSRSELESNYPIIAHHAFMGQDWRRALRYQILTGQRAQQLFANREAIEHFQKALQSAEHLPPAKTIEQRQQIHAALGKLLTTTGRYEEALDHLTTAHSLAAELDERDTLAHACRRLAQLYEQRGEFPPALDWIQEGLAVLQNEETTEAAELLLRAGIIHLRQGNVDEALEQSQNSLRLAQTLDNIKVLARAYNLLGSITLRLGQSATAVEHFRQALEMYHRSGDIHGQATAHNLIATSHFNLGQWQEAERHYRWAREIFSQIGDIYHRAGADNNLGGIALNQGRLDEAVTLYRESLRSLEQISGSRYLLGLCHMNLGATFIRRGEIHTAVEHLHTAQDYFERAQANEFLPELHHHFAEASLFANELTKAETQGQQALNLARELSMRGEEGKSLRVLGEIALAQTRFKQAERYFDLSISLLREAGDEYEHARSRLSQARLYISQDKEDAALAAVEQCIAIFQRLDAALDLAAAHALREEMAGAT